MSLQVPTLPPVIEPLIRDEKSAVEEAAPVNKPKIVIIYSKKIDDDIPLISQYGKVIKFNPSLVNINLNQIQCDYLLCDASDKVCLDNIERHYGDDNILFCHYGYFFEIDFYENINCITKFRIAKDKADFDKSLLTEKKLGRPNKLVNCLSFLVNFFASLKK
jgi:hypothetical protein